MEIPRPKAEISAPLFDDDFIEDTVSIYENESTPKLEPVKAEEPAEAPKTGAGPQPQEGGGAHRVHGKVRVRLQPESIRRLVETSVNDAVREEILKNPAAVKPADGGTAPLYADSIYEGKYALKEKDGEGLFPVRSCLRVGRDPKYADLIPEGNTTISGKHAELVEKGGVLLVKDTGTSGQGSQNGTFVNGNRIPPNISVEVMAGDLIRFSNAEYLVLTTE